MALFTNILSFVFRFFCFIYKDFLPRDYISLSCKCCQPMTTANVSLWTATLTRSLLKSVDVQVERCSQTPTNSFNLSVQYYERRHLRRCRLLREDAGQHHQWPSLGLALQVFGQPIFSSGADSGWQSMRRGTELVEG